MPSHGADLTRELVLHSTGASLPTGGELLAPAPKVVAVSGRNAVEHRENQIELGRGHDVERRPSVLVVPPSLACACPREIRISLLMAIAKGDQPAACLLGQAFDGPQASFATRGCVGVPSSWISPLLSP